MKVIKGLGCVIACVLMCAGLAMYAIHEASNKIVTEDIVSKVVDEMTNTALAQLNDVSNYIPSDVQDQIDQVTSQLPEDMQEQVNAHLNDALPEAAQEKLEDVKADIANDGTLNEMTQKYMDSILSGVIDGESELPDVNKDMQDLAQSYVPKISEATGIEISDEQVQRITNEISERVDLQGVMNDAVEKLNTSLSPAQKQVLSGVRFVQSGPVFMVSLACMIAGIVLVILCTLHPLKWMLYAGGCALVSGLALFAGSKIAESMINAKLAQLGDTFASIGDGVFTSLFQSGIWFCAGGVILLVLYALFTFVKQHVAYE